MRIGIVGSRGYTAMEKVWDYVDALPLDATVVSGGGGRVDKGAVARAAARGLMIREHLPDTKRYPIFAVAAKQRNRKIVEDSDELIAFWDGMSPGAANTVCWAVALGRRVTVVLP